MNHYRDSTDTSMDTFPGVLGEIVFYRTYSRPQGSGGSIKMQTWEENARRNADLLAQLGDLTPAQRDAIYNLQVQLKVTPPGRVLWAGEHSWINREGYTNYLGLFNCVGIQPTSWKWFGYNFLLLMMGCGVGAVIEEDIIDKLPPINKILPQVTITHPPGTHRERLESTTYTYGDNELTIHVGDSKEGWVDSYVRLLEVCSDPRVEGLSHIYIDLGHVRPNGSPIKGFGGTANPVALPLLYEKVMNVLGSAKGRKVTPYEACLLLNWAAVTTVAGNIRRSARWDGYSYGSPSMTGAKDNLWSQNEEGQWVIDPEKDALRMVNISGIIHTKPTLGECISFVRKQYETGEGALYYAPAALVRTNADLLPTKGDKDAFENAYTLLGKSIGRAYLRTKLYEKGVEDVEGDLDHRMMRYGANPCCEVLGTNFVCSISQVDLSRYDTSSPTLWDDIYGALDTAALIVCALLKRGFDIPELQSSRQVDPIVAVTLNGVFDFMVNMWGEPWLRWWMAGCPEWWVDSGEWMAGCPEWWVDSGDIPMDSHTFMESTKVMLTNMRDRVRGTVTKYCTEHGLKVPNRYTAMQPSGSKSCLTGGTPACYPPKGAYWIRRVTLRRDHPVALAAIAAGYKVVPSTSCRDDNNALIDDAYDPRVTEWLVEIPERCVWADKVQGTYDVAKAPITSQWYLTMACQRYFVTHNTSSTLELNGDEVETLAGLIYKEIQDGGDYVSSAIFARDGYTMPRMPYEPITKEQYMAIVQEVESHNNHTPFKELVEYYYNLSLGGEVEVGPTVGCDGDACTIPNSK